MFIIDGRTAGVIAALAITAAVAVLGYVWDPVDVVDPLTSAKSTPGFTKSVGPLVRPVAFAANDAETARAIPDIVESK